VRVEGGCQGRLGMVLGFAAPCAYCCVSRAAAADKEKGEEEAGQGDRGQRPPLRPCGR